MENEWKWNNGMKVMELTDLRESISKKKKDKKEKRFLYYSPIIASTIHF